MLVIQFFSFFTSSITYYLLLAMCFSSILLKEKYVCIILDVLWYFGKNIKAVGSRIGEKVFMIF
jgi:hypothetical protein